MATTSEPGTGPPTPWSRRGSRRVELSLRGPWLLAGIALIVVGLGMILISTAFNGSHKARLLGGVVPVNPGARNPLDISSNNTPNITGNPLNATNLVVASKVDSPSYSCALDVSFDGGAHWSQTPIPAPAGEEPKCYAPDASFGADGTLYYSFVTLAGRANAPHAAWLVTSRDGGQTLSPPIRTPLGADAFQVRVAADPRVPGRVYLTWLKSLPMLGLYSFRTTGNPIEATRSDDGGRHWTAPATVSSAGRSRVIAPTVAFGPSGQLYVLYLDLGGDRGLADLGGTLGLLAAPRNALAVWTDTRAGTRVSLKQDIARAIVAFNDPQRISSGLKIILRIIGGLLLLLGLGVIALLGFDEVRPAVRGGSTGGGVR